MPWMPAAHMHRRPHRAPRAAGAPSPEGRPVHVSGLTATPAPPANTRRQVSILKTPGRRGGAIFGAKAGDPAWSPIWDHWTAVWNDEADATTLLTTQAEIDAAEADGLITLHHGTPDTDGMGFAVNCPSPIVAPNDFEVT